jgi:hypothetical protein
MKMIRDWESWHGRHLWVRSAHPSLCHGTLLPSNSWEMVHRPLPRPLVTGILLSLVCLIQARNLEFITDSSHYPILCVLPLNTPQIYPSHTILVEASFFSSLHVVLQ